MVPAHPNPYCSCDNCRSACGLLDPVCEGVIAPLICFLCNKVTFMCTICGVFRKSCSFKNTHLTSNTHLAYIRDKNNSLNEYHSLDNQDDSDDNTTLPTSTKEYLDA